MRERSSQGQVAQAGERRPDAHRARGECQATGLNKEFASVEIARCDYGTRAETVSSAA